MPASAEQHAKTELWLIRHGESQGNRIGVMQGQDDFPLTDIGNLQALHLADRLRSQRFAALYCSDLTRARHTAETLGETIGLTPVADQRLREIDTGAWSGLTNEQVKAQFPTEWATWQKCDPTLRRGGGESYREAAVRITAALSDLAMSHPGERILVVAHGGVLRGYLAQLIGLPLNRQWHLSISNASLSRVRPFHVAIPGDPPKLGRVLALNDTAHLESEARLQTG